jgi:septation ring formation regulator EzrA
MLHYGDGGLAMAQDFSRVVEDVKQVSTAEKEELQELLKSYLIQERRREIEQNYEASLDELREGTVTFSGDTDTLRKALSNDF